MKNIIIAFSAALLLASCGSKTAEKESPESKPEATENVVTLTDTQYKNAGIETGKLEKRDVSSTIQVNGRIQAPPQNLITVSVPMGGYLKSTNLLPGTPVKKGERIAVMKGPEYIQLQQDYLTANAQYHYLKSEYERQKGLNETKATSDKVFEQAKADYLRQLATLKALGEKLKLIGLNPANVTADNISETISIYSPINGFVNSVNVNIGKYVSPTDALFELINPSKIYLSLKVFGADINKLSVGQEIVAFSNTDPDKKYPCKIAFISRSISEENATEVRCHFEKYDKSLIPGMFMNAEIQVSSSEGAALPDAAVVRYGNGQYIFLAKGNNQFEMQEVKTGNSENGYVAILNAENLKNQKVVTKGAYTLLMALKNEGEEE